MIKEEYKYSSLTRKIIGAAMAVHSAFGNGLQEVIYHSIKNFSISFLLGMEG